MNMDDEAEAFLQEVDWVSKEVHDIIHGKVDVRESELREMKKKQVEDYLKREKENLELKKLEDKKRGHEGKGIKFEKFAHYCKFCSREFELPTPKCVVCSRETQSSEDRKVELTEKVAQYKLEKSDREEKKNRWENWKKTEAMLYKKNSTNYKKWEFFVDETEEETQAEFIPPENDPNFTALEQDIKTRAEKRSNDLKIANELKDKGNDFYRQGKYRNAILKYEEAQNYRKDLMVLYTNCAAAKIKIEDFDGAIKDCSRVIEYFEVFEKEVENNKETLFKAFYRRGDGYRAKQNFTEAVFDYEKALDLKVEPALENLLERAREEAACGGIQTVTEEIKSSDEIITGLKTPEQINEFRVTGGYVIMFKRIYESMDSEALKVLEFLMSDEEKFIQLQPLILPLYDKRQTAAVVLLDSVCKYKDNTDFSKRIIKILTLSIENKHIRDEIAKHSASTKGKKFYKLALEIFCINEFSKEVAPIISNLCLTSYKSALYRKPCPGNMKSLIRHSWAEFKPSFLNLLASNTSEALSLLCNMCADAKLKILIISESSIISKGIDVCLNGTKSLDVERSVGFLNNILVKPTDLIQIDPFIPSIFDSCLRLYSLSQSTPEITERAYRLLFRLLVTRPGLSAPLSSSAAFLSQLQVHLTSNSQHSDSIAKIFAACASSPEFTSQVPVDSLSRFLSSTINQYEKGEAVEERTGNLCLAAGRWASCKPESSTQFKSCIPALVKIAKERLGPVRKNVAICLGKICNCEENKEVLRDVHGVEVLNSIMAHLDS